jgi:hypothetical protein
MSDSTAQTQAHGIQALSSDYVIDSIADHINIERSDEDGETDSNYPSKADGQLQAELIQSQEVGSKGTLET